jgi:predicted amidohydrolase YtcJ
LWIPGLLWPVLIITGDIITMDPARPRVRALAVQNGRIIHAGSAGDARSACPAGTPVLALPGTIVPGLIDSHVHMLWGGRDTERLDVSDARSVGEFISRVRAYARENPSTAWLSGSASLDPEDLAEGRFPTAEELELATAGRPLFLSRRAHDAIVNRSALRAAGIGPGTPDPLGGVIERDRDGEATGLLVERPAADLVQSRQPADTLQDRLRWLAAIQRTFLAAGITSVVDPALEAEELLAYQAAAQRGLLRIRTLGMPLGDGEVAPEDRAASFTAAGVDLTRRDGEMWRIGPWKLFLDGGGSLGTALLDQPWPQTDGYMGNQTTSTAGLHAYARWAAAAGTGLGVHAVGSAAIDLTLDAFAAAAQITPLAGLGFTLIHAYLWPSPAQMRRARDLGVLVATQSPLQWSFGPGLIRRFGEAAIGRAHPMRSWLASGAIVGGGSDGPAGPGGAPVDPLWAFWQMRRRTIAGRDDPIGAEEAVDAEQALHLYTRGAAAVALAADRGRLAAGCVADLAALDVDPLRASPEACRDGHVLATMVGGELHHDAR